MKITMKLSIHNPMKSFFLCLAACSLWLTPSSAQVPVTINRSVVASGGTISLPAISGQGVINYNTLGGGQGSIANYISSYGTVSSDPAWMTVTSVAGSGTPASYNWIAVPNTVVTAILMPTVTIATNAPVIFTNTVSATLVYSDIDHSAGFFTPLTQTYLIAIVEDGGGGGIAAHVTLSGQADPMQSISRQDTSTPMRKLMGFSLVANTNATLTSVAFALFNPSLNGDNFLSLALYQDTSGQGQFDANATLIAMTTNANSFAIFSGLTNPISTNSTTWFLAASFQPSSQPQYSFLAATLDSRNIVATLAETNQDIEVSGGNFLGQQYAFLDPSFAENVAAQAALNTQINSSVAGATNAQTAAFNAQLTAATNAQASALAAGLAGLGNTTTLQGASVKKSNFMDTVLPAAAAGTAAIGAAFSSDSLNQHPLSREYQMK